jgi:LacI family transcriptional regulator
MTTINDVAKRAKVSIATVSYAFNKPHLVKAETHERILEAARELNYKPNLFARGLAGGKSQMVGLLVTDIRYPFTATVARGIEDVLRTENYLSFISSTDGDTDETIDLLENLHNRGVEGFILVPSYFGVDARLLRTLRSMSIAKIPVIVAGFQLEDDFVDAVTFRPQAATREGVNHLIQLGHRHVAYIGIHHLQGYAVARYLGYQESLLMNQIPLRPELVVETDITPTRVREAMAALFALETPPTAVFAETDIVALGVIDFCRERNIRVPEELSLVAFDYQTLVQRTTPAITSVVISAYEVGRKAAKCFLARQQNPDIPTQHVALNYHFEARETTASPAPISKQ